MGYGRGKGTGSGSMCGLGFICSVVCVVVSGVCLLNCVTCMFLPLWQSGSNYTLPDEIDENKTSDGFDVTGMTTVDQFYQGLFYCCYNFSVNGYECYPCSDLYPISSWQGWSSGLYSFGTSCMLFCAVAAFLMVCDCCRGCLTSIVYTAVATVSFLCTLAAIIVFGVGQVDDGLNLDAGYWLALVSVILGLVSSMTFAQAICTTI